MRRPPQHVVAAAAAAEVRARSGAAGKVLLPVPQRLSHRPAPQVRSGLQPQLWPQCVWRENRRVFEALNRMCAVSKELYLLC